MQIKYPKIPLHFFVFLVKIRSCILHFIMVIYSCVLHYGCKPSWWLHLWHSLSQHLKAWEHCLCFFKIMRYLIYAQEKSAGIKNSLLVVFVDNCTGNVHRYLPFVRQCTALLPLEQGAPSTAFFSPLLLLNPASSYLGGTASMFCLECAF